MDPSRSPDYSTGLGTAETADHVRRLQHHGLLTPTSTTGSSDVLDQQATTQSARDLWPVWSSAYMWAHKYRAPVGPGPVAVPIEDTLRLIDHPLTSALLPRLRQAQATEEDLAKPLTTAGLAELDGHLDLLHEASVISRPSRRFGGPQALVRITDAGRGLADVQVRLEDWWHQHSISTAPDAASALAALASATRADSARTRTVGVLAADPPTSEQAPAVISSGPGQPPAQRR
ncbi:DNA-binding HxlR family transcriptional regulator [Kitasatospora sp. MAP12-15]|uniref:hypothetical protein n=1 Tax=unclassified Kitasatospora TaxID=2633591 RepID=UPI0024757145|nr:hypothetical protein [Kitasatospora sp. MAP12-44]MDH6111349.1 DNA-binding HxlR family transcriptional regulator [Kitasatospora sp. MAP12-44]